ncbi:hypothetical protein [Phenylobacterium sp.]|uniref:hypothetical protein n=1 Tax=Phenylobacterium sp. TaxID=1871053 RepID=UPI002E37AB80|nr:hypothetical protein [Phenylobacterium sp.]HEX2561932.1 hypothetical protein [Phenylobacterium sp.]
MRAWVFATAAAVLASSPAQAGESACWFEEGTLVVPAVVAGAAGDYILDTGTARTILHDTRAQAEGFEQTQLTGEVRVAGVVLRERPVVVEGLDARTYAHPTPIAGVIGADVLSGFVLDVSYSPCRIALHRPASAPPTRGAVLPMGRFGHLPLAPAGVTDGVRGARGPWILAVSQPLPARLNEAVATVPGAAKPEELYPGGVWTAQLAGLSFAGQVAPDVQAGLLRQAEADGALGAIGSPVLSRWTLRFDFPRGRLTLKEQGPPLGSDGPR